MDKVTIYNFTDPMMGLSYESEPFFRQLETHFSDQVALKFVMGGLVRDVADFMIADDFREGEGRTFIRYNARLAKIYESEQGISGMPIKMDKLNLFSAERRSSTPLNLAYKAAQLTESSKEDQFLYRLRYATIVEQRETNREAEIFAVAQETGLDMLRFKHYFNDGAAQQALAQDWQWRAELGVRGLPAYLFEYQGKQRLVSGVLTYEHLASIIVQFTQGNIQPTLPKFNAEILQHFMQKHPLVSLIELQYAFGFSNENQILQVFIQAQIPFKRVGNGHFMQICL
ncbi:DsbA family protein [Bibersteinia trehalosi]|nr:DsbA family protein [Bibersteinia trehalosi]